MTKYKTIKCRYCGKKLKRSINVKKAVCFDCKMDRNRVRARENKKNKVKN